METGVRDPSQTRWQVQIHPQLSSAWTDRVTEEMQGRKNHALDLKKLFWQMEKHAHRAFWAPYQNGLWREGFRRHPPLWLRPRALEMTWGTRLSWGLKKVSALPLQFVVSPRNKSNSDEKKWNCKIRAAGSLGDHPVVFPIMDGVKGLKNGRVYPGSQWVRGMNAAGTPSCPTWWGFSTGPWPRAGSPQSSTEAVCTPMGDEKQHRNQANGSDSHSSQGPTADTAAGYFQMCMEMFYNTDAFQRQILQNASPRADNSGPSEREETRLAEHFCSLWKKTTETSGGTNVTEEGFLPNVGTRERGAPFFYNWDRDRSPTTGSERHLSREQAVPTVPKHTHFWETNRVTHQPSVHFNSISQYLWDLATKVTQGEDRVKYIMSSPKRHTWLWEETKKKKKTNGNKKWHLSTKH